MTDTQTQPPSPLDAFMQTFAGTTWDMADVFARLRDEEPVVYVPMLDMWVVSRYEDVVVALRDVDRFIQPLGVMGDVPPEVAPDLPGGYPLSRTALTNADPPEHTRIRKLAQKPLAPRAVREYEPMMRAVADALIDGFQHRGRVELVSEFAFPFSVTILANVMGIPGDRLEDFRRWVLGTFELMVPTITPERRIELAREQVELSDFVREAIAERRRSPGSDLISGLVQAREDGQPGLSESECLGVVAQLITGGFETTQGTIALAVNALCEDPDLLARVRADPSLFPGLVDETVRRFCPARGVFRDTTQDVELHGRTIPRGSRIFVLVGAANQDATQFGCPHHFDIAREPSELRRHVGFGQGIHKCIGIALAQLDIRVALEHLVARLPGLRHVEGTPRPMAMGFVFSTPQRLECAWDTDTDGGQ